jgi:hypothetical protein
MSDGIVRAEEVEIRQRDYTQARRPYVLAVRRGVH